MPLALLIDHDADTRHMYGEFLRHSAYETEEAEDGREGLAKAISHRPAVIVTETRLPGMSGLEMCRVLRSDHSTRSIPIVVVTGDGLPGNIKLAEAAGADAVLVKPCLPDRLAGEIQRVRSARGREDNRRVIVSASHRRCATSEPPSPPPALVCPACDRRMAYVKSQIGGVSERYPEQWDFFQCPACGATFEYRQRTRKVRPYGSDRRPVRLR